MTNHIMNERALEDSREVLGKVEIPRLRVSLFILEGTDQRTLQLAPGHIENTALPGDAGSVVIAGHRDPHFRVLENVRKGDAISITTSEGVFEYIVQWTNVVSQRMFTCSVLLPGRN